MDVPIAGAITYRLDLLTLSTIAATALDAWTTYYFIAHGLGVETNPILGPLAKHSLIWIPVYGSTPALLIPTMPDVCRQTFAIPYLAAGVLLGINNLCGIQLGWFALIDSLGFYNVQAALIGTGVIAFMYKLAATFTSWTSAARSTAIVVSWLAAFGAIETLFYFTGRIL